ncbi:hypothetical protein [Bacillus sp. EB600]|uniref:hypothetical protein n=1 Tax=Bacillus sp. EB600 TaxID=2806345 RepID=UPI00210DCBE0|nr:hypothetical protein [Bacillus sp. EB600]MCQ6279614.1 hypothetical protein [Bacillus sp. EB600]
MLTLSNIHELYTAKIAMENMRREYPALFEKLLDLINLTRALQFKYYYMGCLIMEKDPGEYKPNFVYGSVHRLYKKELQKLKEDQDFQVLKQIFSDLSSSADYSKICLLVRGMAPESLIGLSSIR